jgi:hypothetical protein
VTQAQKAAMRRADKAVRKEKHRVTSMLDNLGIDKVKIPQEMVEAAKQRQQVEPQEAVETA